MLTLILADAELELVPDRLKGHRAVSAPAKTRGKRTKRTLLDASLHHHAIRETDLPEGERRGRPDIVHLFLLTALDSVLNQQGGLRVRVHTRHDAFVTVLPETRVMRNYDRFKGLVEKLFEQGRVGPGDRRPLMTLEPETPLKTALAFEKPDHVLAIDPAGDPADAVEALPALAGEHDHVAVLIPGFPKGGWKSPVDALADGSWALHDEPLSAWVNAAELLVAWRHATKGMDEHRPT